tara:strand:+ start:44093 stop:44986 length:894 start_codon:yes stop_codon:yes gene_type:complete
MNINEIYHLINSIKRNYYQNIEKYLILKFLKYRFKLLDYQLLNKDIYTRDILFLLFFDLPLEQRDNFTFENNLNKDLINLYKELCKVDTYYRQVCFDKSCTILLYPHTENKTLGIFQSEDITVLKETIKKKKKVFDYHYQNSTDRPYNIKPRNWKIREKDWFKINLNNYLYFPIFENQEQIKILENIFNRFENKNIDNKYFEGFSHNERFYKVAKEKFLDILTKKYIKKETLNNEDITTYIYSSSSFKAKYFYKNNQDYCEKRINKLKNYYLSKINHDKQNVLDYFYTEIKEVNNEK